MGKMMGVEKYIEPYNRCCSNYCLHYVKRYSTLLCRDVYFCTQKCRGVYDDEHIDCSHYKLDLNHYDDVFTDRVKSKKTSKKEEELVIRVNNTDSGNRVFRVIDKTKETVKQILDDKEAVMLAIKRHYVKEENKRVKMTDAEFERLQQEKRKKRMEELQKEHADTILQTMITSFVDIVYIQMEEAQASVERKILK